MKKLPLPTAPAPMMMMMISPLCALALAGASPAHADELGDLLKSGPVVRIENDAAGNLKRSTCITDVEAPVETVWRVLNDFESYRFFMPRIKSLEVTREGNDAIMAIKLDTPLVSTTYSNRMMPDHATRTLKVKQVKGDLEGSNYHWRVLPLGEGRARIFYTGIIKNFSSIAESFEDDQHTLSIGINVVSLMAAAKAVKARSELLEKQARPSSSLASPPPAAALASGG